MNTQKIALVIGGSGDIGSSIVQAFTQAGFKVYATYFDNQEKARQKIGALKECELISCDIQNDDSIKDILDQLWTREARLDVVVNAITPPLKLKPFEQLTKEEFDEDLEIILQGGVRLLRRVIPLMKQQKSGVIITLLTITVIDDPPARMSSYVAAKAGLQGLMRVLAAEVQSFNIRLVNVASSFVETKLLQAFPPKLLEIMRERQPSKQFLQPDDIAAVALNIAKKEKDYPNGSTVILRDKNDVKI